MSYEFNHDWFSGNIPRWAERLKPLVGLDHAHVVELGCYEGRATTWLLDNVFTAPTTRYFVVDTFKGGADHTALDFSGVKARFLRNVAHKKYIVSVLEGDTQEMGRKLESGRCDFAYVDASHDAADTLADCVLAHRLLKPGGLCICDDYGWPGAPGCGPKEGIDAFLAAYGHKVKLEYKGYQVDWVKQ